MYKKILIINIIFFLAIGFFLYRNHYSQESQSAVWQVRSIDTMKYSRDISNEKLKDPSFDAVIDRQVRDIAQTGATHVALGTPYDEEFVPFLTRWVKAARKYNLKVWFRGNFAGWEGWFDYERIDPEEHKAKLVAFIQANASLFAQGDIFSACPECENGGPGDPRKTGDVDGHRQFLIDEYKMTKAAFAKIGKKVYSNYNSMNGDVARLVMDKQTTETLDGIVVIDHYVGTPGQLVMDVNSIAKQSGGKIVLGEVGAPIPDIHGDLSEDEQAAWLSKTLEALLTTDKLVGINYWTSVGGTTQLWDENGKARKAAGVIGDFYRSQD